MEKSFEYFLPVPSFIYCDSVNVMKEEDSCLFFTSKYLQYTDIKI